MLKVVHRRHGLDLDRIELPVTNGCLQQRTAAHPLARQKNSERYASGIGGPWSSKSRVGLLPSAGRQPSETAPSSTITTFNTEGREVRVGDCARSVFAIPAYAARALRFAHPGR